MTFVVDVWDFSREESGWIPRFSRPSNDWELEEVERHFHMLQDKKALPSQEGKILLKETKFSFFVICGPGLSYI